MIAWKYYFRFALLNLVDAMLFVVLYEYDIELNINRHEKVK